MKFRAIQMYVLLTLGLVCYFAGCATPGETSIGEKQPHQEPKIGQPAPELGLEKLLQAPDGAKVDWKSLKGKVVVLEFWATWCGPCIANIPHLNELADEFADRSVQFISITDEPESVIKPFLKKKPIHGWVGLDTDGSVFGAYGVSSSISKNSGYGRPHSVVVDKNGVIVTRTTNPKNITKAHLAEALAGKRPHVKLRTNQEGRRQDTGQDVSSEPIAPFKLTIIPAEQGHLGPLSEPGKITWRGTSLKQLIAYAYDVRWNRLFVAPALLNNYYDVELVFDKGEGGGNKSRESLRAILEINFDLDVRLENRNLEVLILSVPEDGQTALPSSGIPYGRGYFNRAGQISSKSLSVDELASALETWVGRLIINETGLTDHYVFELTWDYPKTEALFDAIREQLGLVLTPAKRDIEVLVVEKAGE